MKLAIIAIGIPGSGKTTLLTPLAEKYGMKRVSRDEIRQEWFGDPLIQIEKERVQLEAERRTKEALARGIPVIMDSTFTEPHKRRDAISAARAGGAARVVALCFTTPLDRAKEQNLLRKSAVDESVIEMLHGQLESMPPSLEEGFDALYTDGELELLQERELKNP